MRNSGRMMKTIYIIYMYNLSKSFHEDKQGNYDIITKMYIQHKPPKLDDMTSPRAPKCKWVRTNLTVSRPTWYPQRRHGTSDGTEIKTKTNFQKVVREVWQAICGQQLRLGKTSTHFSF